MLSTHGESNGTAYALSLSLFFFESSFISDCSQFHSDHKQIPRNIKLNANCLGKKKKQSDVGGGTKSKPLFFRRKCTNEVTDSSDEKPQDFINHTTTKQYDHFRTLAVPRNPRGREARAKNGGFSLCPNKGHLNSVEHQVVMKLLISLSYNGFFYVKLKITNNEATHIYFCATNPTSLVNTYRHPAFEVCFKCAWH